MVIVIYWYQLFQFLFYHLVYSLKAFNGNQLQYSCLENPMDRGVWRATTVHGLTKSQTRLSDSHTHTHTHLSKGGNWFSCIYLLTFYWSVIALQCCVASCCKWTSCKCASGPSLVSLPFPSRDPARQEGFCDVFTPSCYSPLCTSHGLQLFVYL